MSYLLFIDESGFDQRESPYQVLAGIAVRDDKLWPLVTKLQGAEEAFFGMRVSAGTLELKGKKLLKRKVFRLAHQLDAFPEGQRRSLARSCLEKGLASKGGEDVHVTRDELTALAQAKVAFAHEVFAICQQLDVKAFATVVPKGAPAPPASEHLRKDYSYLFQRYFYFLQNKPTREQGLVVFDELDKTQCHLLVEQMCLYFRKTAKGKHRAERIIPEPFFVHSDLTTAIQVADLVAYITAWGVKLRPMKAQRRLELASLSEAVLALSHYSTQRRGGNNYNVGSFTLINDLRPRTMRPHEEK